MYRKNPSTAAPPALPMPPSAKPPFQRKTQSPNFDQRPAERSVVSEVGAFEHVRVAAEHERVPDEEERDEAEPEDREVRAHHVRRVLRPAEAGLDERETGLHEDHSTAPITIHSRFIC